MSKEKRQKMEENHLEWLGRCITVVLQGSLGQHRAPQGISMSRWCRRIGDHGSTQKMSLLQRVFHVMAFRHVVVARRWDGWAVQLLSVSPESKIQNAWAWENSSSWKGLAHFKKRAKQRIHCLKSRLPSSYFLGAQFLWLWFMCYLLCRLFARLRLWRRKVCVTIAPLRPCYPRGFGLGQGLELRF